MNSFATSHEELLIPNASSQEVKSLKARYTLTEVKVSIFERDCSGMCTLLDHVSSFLEKVNPRESLTNLTECITELEGLLKEEKRCSLEEELMLDASSSSTQAVMKELEEKKGHPI